MSSVCNSCKQLTHTLSQKNITFFKLKINFKVILCFRFNQTKQILSFEKFLEIKIICKAEAKHIKL